MRCLIKFRLTWNPTGLVHLPQAALALLQAHSSSSHSLFFFFFHLGQLPQKPSYLQALGRCSPADVYHFLSYLLQGPKPFSPWRMNEGYTQSFQAWRMYGGGVFISQKLGNCIEGSPVHFEKNHKMAGIYLGSRQAAFTSVDH